MQKAIKVQRALNRKGSMIGQIARNLKDKTIVTIYNTLVIVKNEYKTARY